MNRNLVIFLTACFLGVGAILVYAWNNMSDSKSNPPGIGTTQATPNPTGASQQNSQVLSSFGTNPGQTAQSQTKVQPNNQNQQTFQEPQNPLPTGPITDLMIKDISVGSGVEVKNGDTVEVHYVGVFLDGKKFDSSYDRGQPFTFTVGAGNVIRGWDQGLIGMKTGGRRQLVIPSELAYGAAGAPGAIPPNTPLAFEIELVAIK